MLAQDVRLALAEPLPAIPAPVGNRLHLEHVKRVHVFRVPLRPRRQRGTPRRFPRLRLQFFGLPFLFGRAERHIHPHRLPGSTLLDRQSPNILSTAAAQDIYTGHELVPSGIPHEIHDQASWLHTGLDQRPPGFRRVVIVETVRDRIGRPRGAPGHLRIQCPALRRPGHDDHLDAGVVETLRQYAAVADDLHPPTREVGQRFPPVIPVGFPAHPGGGAGPVPVEQFAHPLGMVHAGGEHQRTAAANDLDRRGHYAVQVLFVLHDLGQVGPVQVAGRCPAC